MTTSRIGVGDPIIAGGEHTVVTSVVAHRPDPLRPGPIRRDLWWIEIRCANGRTRHHGGHAAHIDSHLRMTWERP